MLENDIDDVTSGTYKSTSKILKTCAKCTSKIINCDCISCKNFNLDFHVSCTENTCTQTENWLCNKCLCKVCNE